MFPHPTHLYPLHSAMHLLVHRLKPKRRNSSFHAQKSKTAFLLFHPVLFLYRNRKMHPNAHRLYYIYQNILLRCRVQFYNFQIHTVNTPVSNYLHHFLIVPDKNPSLYFS